MTASGTSPPKKPQRRNANTAPASSALKIVPERDGALNAPAPVG
jgi:hypothetical protein